LFDTIVQFCLQNGVYGLVFLAFTEAFVSPILPDVVMLPLCLANPGLAIYYGAVTTAASVAGGLIGYGVGSKLGPICVKRYIPEKHWQRIHNLAEKHGGWTIFWGAIAPIPFKFVSISAGVLRLNFKLFIFISIIGRSKRFLLEAVLLYYLGPSLIEMWERLDEYGLWAAGAAIILALVVMKIRRSSLRDSENPDKCLP